MPSDRTPWLLFLTMLSLAPATAAAQTQQRQPSIERRATTARPTAAGPASASGTAPAPRPAASSTPAAPTTGAGAAAESPSPYSLDSLGAGSVDPATDEEEQEDSEIERRSRWVRQRRDREDPHRIATAPPVDPPVAGAKPAAGPPEHLTNAGPAPQPKRRPDPKTPDASPTRIIDQLVRRSEIRMDFFEMVDEMLDEIAHQLAKEDPQQLSPMAIRLVRVSPNVQPEFARTLESRMLARISRSTGIRMMVCVECTAMRSRVENDNWMVSLGATRQEDLQRLARTIGVKTFMDVGFSFSERANVMWMEATVFRASDGGVMWTDAYRSDATMAALLRTGRRIPSREERAAELTRKLAGRPLYGYMFSLGMMSFGYSGPTGDIAGANATFRLHERFGEDQSNLFGLSAGVFTTANLDLSKALNSILLGAYYSLNLSEPNLNKPEFWLYAEGGGMFSGNQGNTFYVESGGDLHLKWRMSLVAGATYVFPTTYMDHDLGGFGYRVRLAFNW